MDEKFIDAPLRFCRALEGFITDKVPVIVKVEAVNHFQSSFTNQGFTDKTLEKWPERKPPTRKGKPVKGKTLEKWKAKNEGRAILVGHSSDTKGVHLMNSITGENGAGKVTITVDKPYAEVHNEGLKAGRPPGFTMPKRQFIGPSEQLEQKIEKKIENEINKLINSF